MPKELAKQYAPQGTEDRIYQNWCDKGYFHTQIDRSKKPFTIVMPPPNVTGQLHMGHAMDCTLQDILTRFKRMQGYDVMFLTGTDEHGQKIQDKAADAGVTPKEYVDRIVATVKDLWKLLDVSYDRFIRTTDDYHVETLSLIHI